MNLLTSFIRNKPGFEWRYLRRLLYGESATWEIPADTSESEKDVSTDARYPWLALSPDGKLLAAASDKTLRLTDPSLRPIKAAPLPDFAGIVGLFFTADGKVMVVGNNQSSAGMAQVLDGTSHAARRTFLFGHKPAWASILSRGGRWLVTQSRDESIRLLDITSSRDARLLDIKPGHHIMTLSPDGRTLATVVPPETEPAPDYTVTLWDTATSKPLGQLPDHASRVRSVVFSPDGKFIATGCDNGTVRLWEAETRRAVATTAANVREVLPLLFSPDGKMLAGGSAGGALKIWSVPTLEELATLAGHESSIHSLAFSPDGRTLFGSGMDWTVKSWDVAAQVFEQTPLAFDIPKYIIKTVLSPDGKTLAVRNAHDDTTITTRLIDVATRRQLASFESTAYSSLLTFSPDGKLIAVAHALPKQYLTIMLRDAATGATVGRLTKRSEGIVAPLAFSPDGRTLFTVEHGDGLIELWDVASGTRIKEFPREARWDGAVATGAALSPDGKLLVLAGLDSVELWDVALAKPVAAFKTKTFIQTIALSPDARLLAVGLLDGSVILKDIATGTDLTTLKGHKSIITSLAFSPDGQTLATADRSGLVKLWALPSYREAITLGDSGGHLAFSPDGNMLVTAGGKIVRFLRAPPLPSGPPATASPGARR